MPSYEQFITRFKEHIRRVADIDGDGDDNSTIDVIVDALKECGLDDICSNNDKYLETVKLQSKGGSSVVVDDKKVKKVAPKKKQDEQTKGTEATEAKPKRITPYNEFVAEQVRVNKISMKQAAEQWKQMTDEEKAPYAERAKAKSTGTTS